MAWEFVDDYGPGFWRHSTSGRVASGYNPNDAASDSFGREALYRQIWDSTPGGVEQKVQALAGYLGTSGAAQWAQEQGIDASDTGVGRAYGQAVADASEKGTGALREGIKATTLGGTAVLGGLAAAPYVTGAGTGAAVGDAGAATGIAGSGGAAGAAEAALSTAAIPGGGIGATTGAAGSGAASALGATGAGALGTSALNPSEIGMESLEGLSPSEIGMEGSALTGAGGATTLGGLAVGGGALDSFAGGAAAGAASGAGGAGGSATGGAVGSGLGALMGDDDWMRMLLRGVPGILGAVGAGAQAEDFEDLAHEYKQMGAPYRSRLEQLYGNPTAFLNSPEVQQPIQQGTNMLARSLSTQGNPVGSGNALQELQNYASTQLFNRLGQEKDRLGGFGGLTQYNQAAPQMAQNTIGAQGNVYANLGGAAADIFNPPKRFNLQDFLGAY